MNDGPSRVLEILRDAGQGPCSGEALSESLGVSRAQIWKHVEALRRRDYGIDGAPGGGYRLTGVPDRLYPEELARGLATRWLGPDIHYFDSIDSTNRRALELGREGAAHGAAVVAEGQTAGRGRLGRAFFSPPYQNLYTSIVLRPDITIVEAPTLILAAGVAVAEAVAEFLPASCEVEIKWPNDVLVGGRKTSGILMEMVSEESRVDFATLGIGVNLNVERSEFPEEFRELATSLRSAGGERVDRLAFARTLYAQLESVMDAHASGGFAAVRPRFERRFHMQGRCVGVRGSGAELDGVVRGIAEDGALKVEGSDGRLQAVYAGDVTLRKRGVEA
jgi:BirA family biotin operon repressor/biotin-[acetyl-CoA-carboxylase] ligase